MVSAILFGSTGRIMPATRSACVTVHVRTMHAKPLRGDRLVHHVFAGAIGLPVIAGAIDWTTATGLAEAIDTHASATAIVICFALGTALYVRRINKRVAVVVDEVQAHPGLGLGRLTACLLAHGTDHIAQAIVIIEAESRDDGTLCRNDIACCIRLPVIHADLAFIQGQNRFAVPAQSAKAGEGEAKVLRLYRNPAILPGRGESMKGFLTQIGRAHV